MVKKALLHPPRPPPPPPPPMCDIQGGLGFFGQETCFFQDSGRNWQKTYFLPVSSGKSRRNYLMSIASRQICLDGLTVTSTAWMGSQWHHLPGWAHSDITCLDGLTVTSPAWMGSQWHHLCRSLVELQQPCHLVPICNLTLHCFFYIRPGESRLFPNSCTVLFCQKPSPVYQVCVMFCCVSKSRPAACSSRKAETGNLIASDENSQTSFWAWYLYLTK